VAAGATVGTIMLIVVVVTSVKWPDASCVKRVVAPAAPYAYLGVGLALPHQIYDGWTSTGTFTQVYWWTLYAVALAAIIGYRVAMPIGRSLYHRVRVVGRRA